MCGLSCWNDHRATRRARERQVLVLATDDGDRLLIRHCDSVPAAQDMLRQLHEKYPGRKTLLLTEEGNPEATEDLEDLLPFFMQST